MSALYRTILRSLGTRGRLVALGTMGLITVLLAILVRSRSGFDRTDAAFRVVDGYGLSVLVPVVALVFASAALGDPAEDGTLVYLWLRPVPRWQLAVAAAAAAMTISVPVAVAPVVVAAAITGIGSRFVVGAACGALIALHKRDATGCGDLVEVSAQACVVTALSHAPAFVDLLGIEPTRAGAFMTGRSIKGARYRVFWPCRDGYINFIFYGGVAGRRTNEQLVAWMGERGAELGALAAIDWKAWDATRAEQCEVDAIEAPVMKFFAAMTKREFLIEGHRRGMLGYPVSTVADIASDPQLDARAFFQSVAGSAERFCGSFAVIDGVRPPLRHSPGEMVASSVGAGLKPAPTNAAKRAGTSS